MYKLLLKQGHWKVCIYVYTRITNQSYRKNTIHLCAEYVCGMKMWKGCTKYLHFKLVFVKWYLLYLLLYLKLTYVLKACWQGRSEESRRIKKEPFQPHWQLIFVTRKLRARVENWWIMWTTGRPFYYFIL